MNRQKLTELIHHPERVSTRDSAMLSEMAAQYPYATVIHVLLAKSKQQQADARHSLATAALYTPNRHVLRLAMENRLPDLLGPSTEAPSAADVLHEQEVEVQLAPESTSFATTEVAPQPQNDVFDELQKNLKRLREARAKHSLQEEAREAQKASSTTTEKTEATAPATPPLSGITETVQQIIAEHQHQAPENPKIQQQRSLIDSFLENAPNLQRRQQLQQNAPEQITDLSQQLSTPQDLATETLALIMKKQGKTEKAIDIYEKLILKYPQKSVYFANCIEQLKKDL